MTTPAHTAIVATAAIQRPRAAVEKRAPSARREPPGAARRRTSRRRRAGRATGAIRVACATGLRLAGSRPAGGGRRARPARSPRRPRPRSRPAARARAGRSSPRPGRARSTRRAAAPTVARRSGRLERSRAPPPAPPPGLTRPPAAPRSGPGRSRARVARRSPVSRRCTSAWAPAASIVPAATRATSENATSSEITIPAAWDSRISTPVRVMNCSFPSPNVTERAWVSVMSALDGSLSHSSATFGRGVNAQLRARDVDPRRLRQRVRDVVRRDRDPDDPQVPAVDDPQRVADVQVPLVREAALDHDVAPLAVAQVAALGHDVAPATGPDRGHRALARPVAARGEVGVEVLGAVGAGLEVREGGDARVDLPP